jgi:uncharacterized membrane protein YfcA
MTESTTPGRTLRIAAGFMAALFAISIAVQWNDPDPLSWMAIYGVAAALAGAAAAGYLPFRLNAAALVLFLALFFIWLPSLADARGEAFQSFQMRAAIDEEPREAVGLALCALWSGIQTWAARRSRGNVARELEQPPTGQNSSS